MPDELPAHQLSALQRRSIVLVVKEALHNIVQHARATEVRLRLTATGDTLTIAIEDDGCGLPMDSASRDVAAGHDGLANMRSRIAAIGGTCAVAAGAGGRGTVVHIRIPLDSTEARPSRRWQN